MELWMQPQKRAGQRLISFELDLDPAAQLFSYADTFGNAVYHFDIPQPHQQMTIVARSAVETQDPPPPPPPPLPRGGGRLESGVLWRTDVSLPSRHPVAPPPPVPLR